MSRANQHTADYAVISPEFIVHAMEHPARGRRWPVRELAPIVGVSPAWLGHLRTGRSRYVAASVAHALADAVGCHVNVLFVPMMSTDSNNRSAAA